MAGKYASIYHCKRCGNKWRVVSTRAVSMDDPVPDCPNLACGEAQTPIGMDLTSNKAPATVGMNVRVKAMDETSNIVMRDYGMTDLRDDVREGESMAPKLPPVQQAMADGFFGGGKRANVNGHSINMAKHARAAMSGGLRDSVSTDRSIVSMHRNRSVPPTHILNKD